MRDVLWFVLGILKINCNYFDTKKIVFSKEMFPNAEL
jgi:hypothetical protein